MPIHNNLENMTFLRFVGGNSDKYYTVIDLPTDKCLIGYGRSHARGTWTVVDKQHANKKVNEKLKKGYEKDIPAVGRERVYIANNVRTALDKTTMKSFVVEVSDKGVHIDEGLLAEPVTSAVKVLEEHPRWADDW